MLEDDIKIIDDYLAMWNHMVKERSAFDRIKTELAEALKTSHNKQSTPCSLINECKSTCMGESCYGTPVCYK